jgi:hypothetical protein
MHEGTTRAPETSIQPLRRHNLSKQFERPSLQRKEYPPASRTISSPATLSSTPPAPPQILGCFRPFSDWTGDISQAHICCPGNTRGALDRSL